MGSVVEGGFRSWTILVIRCLLCRILRKIIASICKDAWNVGRLRAATGRLRLTDCQLQTAVRARCGAHEETSPGMCDRNDGWN